MNMVALVDGQPKLLNLKQMLEALPAHRREVVTRRTVFELRKARERGHILEGLAVALSNVDDVIALIKAAPTPADGEGAADGAAWRLGAGASECWRAPAAERSGPRSCRSEFGLQPAATGCPTSRRRNPRDALQRLTGLEQDKIVAEYQEVMAHDRRPARHPGQAGARHHDHRRRADQIRAVRRRAPQRDRSERRGSQLEDLIAPEDMVVTLSHARLHQAPAARRYRAQKRGGRGKQAAATKEDDFIEGSSSPTPTTTCCASPTGAGSTGSRSTRCRRAAAPAAASRS